MGENFARLKRRMRSLRIAKSIISALSVWALLFGTLTMLTRFEIVNTLPIYRAAISLGASLVVAVAMWIANGAGDMAVARRLDSEFSLEERTVTMVNFMDGEFEMHEIQRMDADKSLSTLPISTLGRRSLFLHAALLLAALGVFVSSFVVKPSDPLPPATEESAFFLSELQAAALLELVDDVRESEMEFPYKENIALMIEELLTSLKDVNTVTQKDALTLEAMNFIYAEGDVSSSVLELIDALWSTDLDACRALAKALNYYAWPRADEIDRLQKQLTDFRNEVSHKDADSSNVSLDTVTSETELLYLKLSSAIPTALFASGMHESDALYRVMIRLSSANENNEDGTRVFGFSTLATYITEVGYYSADREFEATLTAICGELFDALSQHRANTECAERALKRLSEILDCAHPAFERPSFDDYNSDASFPAGGEGGGGTIGGDLVYGGDDTVLDPFTGEYVKYWEILGRYDKLMIGLLENGAVSEEDKLALEKYFDILYNGFDTDENE